MTNTLGVAVAAVRDDVRWRAALHCQYHGPSTVLNALPHPMVIFHVRVLGAVGHRAGGARVVLVVGDPGGRIISEGFLALI